MASTKEVSESIKEHIYAIVDKRNKARDSGDIKEEKRLNDKLLRAEKYLDDYKKDFNIEEAKEIVQDKSKDYSCINTLLILINLYFDKEGSYPCDGATVSEYILKSFLDDCKTNRVEPTYRALLDYLKVCKKSEKLEEEIDFDSYLLEVAEIVKNLFKLEEIVS